jgi:hypothetical protein
MTAADMARAAATVIPPVNASGPVATVEGVAGRRLPSGSPAGVGGSTTYRAAWLVGGLRLAAFGPAFARPREVCRFIDLLTGGAS